MVVVVFVRCFVYYNADLCIINDNYKSLAKTKITRILVLTVTTKLTFATSYQTKLFLIYGSL